MRVISVHEHLAQQPTDIKFLVESGEFEQIWLQSIGRKAVVPDYQAYEDLHVKVKKEYGNFFELFGYLNWLKGPDNIRRLKDRGFFGLKAIAPPLPYDHESYFPLYEQAAELGMPILFHTGVIGPGTRRKGRGEPIPPPQRKKSKTPISRGPTVSNMRPSMLQPIAATFPHLTLINGHPGFPWLEDAWENLYYYDNIYCDISSGHSFPILDKWAFWFFNERCLNKKLYFTDKLLFALDWRVGGGREMHEYMIRAARFWKDFFEFVGQGKRWGDIKEKEKIFFENARFILKDCKGRTQPKRS